VRQPLELLAGIQSCLPTLPFRMPLVPRGQQLLTGSLDPGLLATGAAPVVPARAVIVLCAANAVATAGPRLTLHVVAALALADHLSAR
jgi:hypothetical protein